MKSLLYIILINIQLGYTHLYAQSDKFGFPFLRNHSAQEYIGSNQNWSILQDSKGLIYVGNTPSILTYDGGYWKATETTNFSAARSMAIDSISGVIYVGASNDFGYLTVDANGKIKYKSLIYLLNKKVDNFNDVWYTFTTKEGVFFISNYLIVRINNGKVKYWESDEGLFHTAFNVQGKIVIRERNAGLKVIDGDVILPIEGSEQFKDDRVDFLLHDVKNSYILGSRTLGLFRVSFNFTNNKNPSCILQKITIDASSFLLENEITKAIKLANGNYAIGTTKGGVIILDKTLKALSIIDDKIGLQDLTVHALFEDRQGNLWLALNNGISCIETNTPFRNITALNGLKGTIKSLLRNNNELFFATSQGLFVFNNEAKTILQILTKPVDCWDIITFDNINGKKSVIVATQEGVYELKDGIQHLISPNRCYKLLQSKKFRNTIYLGLYNGFETIQYINDSWVTLGKLKEIESAINDIDEDDYGNLWICTNIDGIKYLENTNKIGTKPSFNILNFTEADGLPTNAENFIYKINGKLKLNTTFKQLYDIKEIKTNNKRSFTFIPDTLLDAKFYENGRCFYKMNEDKENNIWIQTFFDKNQKFETGIVKRNKQGVNYWYKKPFKRLPDRTQFYSIFPEESGVTWFASSEGVISFDSKTIFNYSTPINPTLSFVISNSDTIFKDGFTKEILDPYTNLKISISTYQQKKDSTITFKYDKNNLTFQFSATSYIASENNKFSCFLEGNDETWSEWNTKREKSYTNLWEKKYIFHLKVQDVFGNESQELTFSFTILPPWYRTIWAIIFYFILGALLFIMTLKLYTKRLNKTINEKTSEIRQQSLVIENKNKEITDSIFYAKKIQEAIMPSTAYINELFAESFVFFKPKDIVSGDFYWATQKGNKILIAASDCTGHGVPGAFMSMLGNDSFNEVVIDRNVLEPDEILDYARTGIIKALKQKGESGENKDGMDVGLISYDKTLNELIFAGANNPIYIIRNNKSEPFNDYTYSIASSNYSLLEIKGNKFPVGIYINNQLLPFTKHTLQLKKGDTFYLLSDGFADQFGGEFSKKFKYNRLKELLLSVQDLPMPEQQKTLNDAFYNWKGNLEQVDDVLIIGVRIT